MQRIIFGCLSVFAGIALGLGQRTKAATAPDKSIALDQVISREDPTFDCAKARLSIGRDGMVYLANPAAGDKSYILRIGRDGQDKSGKQVGEAIHNATANKDGVIAAVHSHFLQRVIFYDKSFIETAFVREFLDNDTVKFDAPGAVEVGESGDFYALDQHRDRILRISPQGKVITAYALPPIDKHPAQMFRVNEKTKQFYVLRYAMPELQCIGFDGKVRWQLKTGVSGNTYQGTNGGFDVDEDGALYTIVGRGSDVIHKYSSDGKPAGDVKLAIPATDQPVNAITALRVFGNEALIKSRSQSELFQVYDLTNGKFDHAVSIDHAELKVTAQAGPWTAGQGVDFAINFDGGGQTIKPQWHVWARHYGQLDYQQLKLDGQKLTLPPDLSGYYQIKVTPEVTPWQQSDAVSEYLVQTIVEIRSPDAKGTAIVATPLNRIHYGRGEAIPFVVQVRGTPAAGEELKLTLSDGATVLAATTLPADPKAQQNQLSIPASMTAQLLPGKYLLSVQAKDLTCVAQPLIIGSGLAPSPFFTITYGDYGPTYPKTTGLDAPDLDTAYAARMQRLGFNLMIDRLGIPSQIASLKIEQPQGQIAGLIKAANADPSAIPSSKLESAPGLLQLQSMYGAANIREMGILLNNDAGLPLDAFGYDGRKPAQMVDDLTTAAKVLRDYANYRGWIWASNWWIFANRGAKAATNPQDAEAYTEAMKKADATGAWSPILEKVTDNRLNYAVSAEKLFNAKLAELAPHEITAAAAPFRNVENYPPVTFANVDETDLQAQWEQVPMPFHAPYDVDFYSRPGKRALAHPGITNDDGTGGQILPTLWQMVMRGATTVGTTEAVPRWYSAMEGNTDDPRLSWLGTASVFRTLNTVLGQYGPWLTTLHNDDKVAIVASSRMFRIDAWHGVMGLHFARVMQAYITCLQAHLPASVVFSDDMTPECLKAYKAVLVVGQTVEMGPKLAAAIRGAQAADVPVFADGTCRPELVKQFKPLGIAFNKLENDPMPAADDSSFFRMPTYTSMDAPALARALSAVRPDAGVQNPQVLISQRKAEDGRYLFVVNNDIPTHLDPGQLWRVTLFVTTRVPQIVPVKLDLTPGQVVYDMFAAAEVHPAADGTVQADCRTTPARIYAILPAAISQVRLNLPATISPGQALPWSASVLDANGSAIHGSIPLRIRLLTADGKVLDELYTSALSAGVTGKFTVPLNAPSGKLTLEAVELLSRHVSSGTIELSDAKPPTWNFGPGNQPAPAAAVADHQAGTFGNNSDFTAAENHFGPHLRDMVITSGGKLAIMNAMNWDNNLYGVDLDTGKISWQKRIGNYFAFEPIALSDGAAVQGYDFNSAQGYFLYKVGADGSLQRRFGLYGLPHRLPQRFVPGIAQDHVNSFAVGDDGKWVATAGNLGLAVWSADGTLLWRQDWYKTDRHTGKVVALDPDTLLVLEGVKATAYGARDGKQKWQQSVGVSGDFRFARLSADGKVCALLNPTDGGHLTILQDGKIVRVFATAAEDAALSADGSLVAVVTADLLKLYSVSDGLQWVIHGDDLMHFPRFSADGRLVVSSGLGTVYVTDHEGKILLQKDVGALAVPAWLPDGGLALATWEGNFLKLDKSYATLWQTHLVPQLTDMQDKILTDDGAPTTAITDWGNASDKAIDLSDNILTKIKPVIRLVGSGNWFGQSQFVDTADQPLSMLYDGKAIAPPEPWIPWERIGFMAETSPINYILIDSVRTQLKVTGVTLVEDPKHPDSWLRDATIDYWDPTTEAWITIQPLLSNSAVHTHMFAKPVESSRFRIMLPWGICGNLRLEEIAFHGSVEGNSAPDVIAKRPRAVLFDEQQDIAGDLMYANNGLTFALQGAYSGGRCLQLTPRARGNGETVASPQIQKPFGKVIRNWDFEIAENPKPGQYRYLEFAWRGDEKTKGVALSLGEPGNYVTFTAGQIRAINGVHPDKVEDAVPHEWKVVKVDLWKLVKKPMRIQAMTLGANGGPAEFDQILLGRTEKDLP